MNAEKLSKLQSQVRIGGKGTARRKKKVVRHTTTTDDKKLQSSLKKLTVNSIPGIEEVNMFKDDGTVIHFTNPKVQASLNSNTFAVTGQAENKNLSDMMPGILNQMRPDNLTYLKNLVGQAQTNPEANATLEELLKNANLGGAGPGVGGLPNLKEEEGEDDVPDLVENFDEVAQIGEKKSE